MTDLQRRFILAALIFQGTCSAFPSDKTNSPGHGALPRPSIPSSPQERLPLIGPHGDYVTSESCRDCHPQEHSSWHRTFHRTMTQLATPQTVLGSFDGSAVTSEGLIYKVGREGAAFWAEMPDPDLMMYVVQGKRKRSLDALPRVRRPVVMATGSHHYQTYWVSSARHPTVLHTLPLVYLLDEKRWIPREAAFMHGPDDQERFLTQWNNQCIRCHSTGGNPGLDEITGQLTTQAAELGIACEACHGPGKAHVQRQVKLLASPQLQSASSSPDPTIINPSRLSSKAANDICGQCHGEYITREEFALENARNGPLYKPGDNLHRTRYYIQHPRPGSSRQRWEDLRRNPEFFRERWWPDGTLLAGGREYTALRASDCFLKGDISCLTCHSMHKSDPNDQLKQGGGTSRSCVLCHQDPKYNAEIAAHTFHPPASSGSDCLNCHMPHVSYALLKAIRSHQIQSPRLDTPSRLAVPNACNLCHLDKSLAWTAEKLASWHNQPRQALSQDQESLPAAVLWLLKGDAAQRAISAWHFGWTIAQQTSGTSWTVPLLVPLLDDPYGVVRQIAWKSLQRVSPDIPRDYDFLSAPTTRQSTMTRILADWHRQKHKRPSPPSPPGPHPPLAQETIDRLLREQDQRSVTIQE